MSDQDRQELVRQAVAFLADPKTQASPFSQRVQFLQAKGLTQPEIDQALQQASATPPSPYRPYGYPSAQQWDWRDYFITAMISGFVTYGAVSLFKKYLLPHLQPPNSTAYEQDRDLLTKQFDEAEALLREIQAETAAVRAAMEDQKEKVEKATKEVDELVGEMRKGELKTRDEMREIREEINNIRDMMPKMIEKNKEAQSQSLAELQQELKSLKALMLTRGPTMSSTPASPLPVVGKPTIPAWQLSGSEGTDSNAVGSNGKDTCMERHASPDRKSIDGKPELSSNSRSSSLDRSPSSPSALADSALSSLRKSIASHRVSNSGRTSKLSLEERLRASFAAGESSSGSTPALSSLPSPSVEPLSESPIDKVPETPSAELHEALTDEKSNASHSSDVDSLQERLKLVEQRFNDVSMSFKQLQAEKDAADTTLRELTSLRTIQDVDALRAFLQDTHLKSEMSQEEIKKLNAKIQTQEGRLEDLRDTHRLESSSQSQQIEQLRRRLSETEALLEASQDVVARGQGDSVQNKAETDRLNAEVEKFKAHAKEEEEKRVKAISLLKTVRQKLVKAEKEKEEAVQELNSAKDRDKEGVEKEQAEKLKLMEEVETARAERERSLQALKIQFDKEIANIRDRHEKELSALKGQLELEALNAKSTYGKDSAAKASQIARLESSVESLSRDKNDFFEQLQIRQAELESSQSHLESLQSLVTELQYQLRESQDRVALLNEELVELQREHESHQREPSNSSDKVAQLLSASNAKYEAKLSDLKKTLATVETERAESEAEWSRKLREKVQEADQLRQVLSSAAKNKKEDEGLVDHLKAEVIRLQEEVDEQKGQVSTLKSQIDTVDVMQNSARDQEVTLNAQNASLKEEIEECKAREAQLRLNNKNLREELRKVQSSAALLERQRNPGVGYWTSRGNTSPSEAMPAETKQDEEVNLEYLRNVILQFLEHKEMRPNLVKVLSIILHFTPQETRRLIAKV